MPLVEGFARTEYGGITLILAVVVLVQVFKRKYRQLEQVAPVLVVALIAALVVSALWSAAVFVPLAATVLLSATAFGGHALVQRITKEPAGKE